MDYLLNIFISAWDLLVDSAPYVLFGLLVAGLMKVFINPNAVAKHLGRGRFSSVFKAALLGVPLPLCSCGVLPAAAGLKRQGANNGATAAFLISTPESGVDSMAITYALMDPVMTVARPVAAMATAVAAGLSENLLAPPPANAELRPDLTCQVDGCCDGTDCDPAVHSHHHTWAQKIAAGLRYAFGELWGDLAAWFMVGILLAGVITALAPVELMSRYLGGGASSMFIMLAAGIPIYICATASTPIAAALILKGVSPGAALVFLLAGPATNVTSLTVLYGLLGKRATAIYLAAIAVCSLLAGLALDQAYALLGINARAVVGQAAEIIPYPLQLTAAVALLLMSAGPVYRSLKKRFSRGPQVQALDDLLPPGHGHGSPGCSCGHDH